MLDATRKLLTGRASLAGSGRKEGPLGKLWAEGASGKRDFALSEPDVTELLATFVRHFPAGGSLEQISQGLEGTVDDARGMLRVLCAYFNRQASANLLAPPCIPTMCAALPCPPEYGVLGADF